MNYVLQMKLKLKSQTQTEMHRSHKGGYFWIELVFAFEVAFGLRMTNVKLSHFTCLKSDDLTFVTFA